MSGTVAKKFARAKQFLSTQQKQKISTPGALAQAQLQGRLAAARAIHPTLKKDFHASDFAAS
jgi:hypothetical protein